MGLLAIISTAYRRGYSSQLVFR